MSGVLQRRFSDGYDRGIKWIRKVKNRKKSDNRKGLSLNFGTSLFSTGIKDFY
jgi:hypothetical protein